MGWAFGWREPIGSAARNAKPSVISSCCTSVPRLTLDGSRPKFQMPKRVIVVDELPRNAMGKVQKNILRDTYAKIYAK
jgi:acyl-CoA synthetase (AMP-forming)/AMP-acid ligase II